MGNGNLIPQIYESATNITNITHNIRVNFQICIIFIRIICSKFVDLWEL